MLTVDASLFDAEFTYADGSREGVLWSDDGEFITIDAFPDDFGVANALADGSNVRLMNVSLDRNVIAGNGINPDGFTEGWVAVRSVPEPSTFALWCIAILTYASGRKGGRHRPHIRDIK